MQILIVNYEFPPIGGEVEMAAFFLKNQFMLLSLKANVSDE